MRWIAAAAIVAGVALWIASIPGYAPPQARKTPPAQGAIVSAVSPRESGTDRTVADSTGNHSAAASAEVPAPSGSAVAESEEELSPEFAALAETIPDADRFLVLDLMRRPDSQPPSVSATLAAVVLRRWAETRPADAAGWVAALPGNAFKRSAYREVARTWAAADLAAARRWVTELPAEVGTEARLAVADAALTQNEPQIAVALLAFSPPSAWRDDLLINAVVQWSTTDPQGAADATQPIVDPVMRERLAARLAGRRLSPVADARAGRADTHRS